MIETLGGRKFIFAILTVVLGFILVVLKEITAEDWLQMAQVVGGVYVMGNVATKLTEKI